KSGSRGTNTRNGKGLAVLERENPIGFPASQHTIDERPTIREEPLVCWEAGKPIGFSRSRTASPLPFRVLVQRLPGLAVMLFSFPDRTNTLVRTTWTIG